MTLPTTHTLAEVAASLRVHPRTLRRAIAPTAFAAALDDLDLSQTEFARLTGMTNGTVSRWVRGVLPVPIWAERLLDAWAITGVPSA